MIRMIYRGPDEFMLGGGAMTLMHGVSYQCEVKNLKNGKIKVVIHQGFVHGALMYGNQREFEAHWI